MHSSWKSVLRAYAAKPDRNGYPHKPQTWDNPRHFSTRRVPMLRPAFLALLLSCASTHVLAQMIPCLSMSPPSTFASYLPISRASTEPL